MSKLSNNHGDGLGGALIAILVGAVLIAISILAVLTLVNAVLY